MHDTWTTSAALLLLRVIVGGLTVCHGLAKVTPLFGGAGLKQEARNFAALGFRFGTLSAVSAGSTQILAGVLLLFGFATPLGGAAMIGVMVVACVATARNGLWGKDGGFEYPAVLAVTGAVFALAGPGAASGDTDVLHWRTTPAWGGGAILLGLVAGVVVAVLLRRGGPGEA
jgi:putative oxidoreductase